MPQLYLDHNATTPIDPRVVETMQACYAAEHANPASLHQSGQRARSALEAARDGLARLLGADISGIHSDRVIFTSGGTEANNLALLGWAGGEKGRVLVSSIEHPSVLGAAEELARRGFDVRRLRVSSPGVVDVNHLVELLTPETRLVSVMLGNHETGVLQPVAEIAAICRERGVPLHTDAVQVVGKLAVHFRDMGVTAMSLAAHKFHGPVGVGALVLRHGAAIDPQLFGGFQQAGLRPGTEPLVLAVGMHRALELWHDEAEERRLRLTQLRDDFEAAIIAELPTAVVNGRDSPRLPHTSNISFIGLERQSLFMALDLAGVACATGSACASGSSEPSPVLTAMGLDNARLTSAIRFSFGARTTVVDVAEAVRKIVRVCQDLQRQEKARKSAPAPRPWLAKPV